MNIQRLGNAIVLIISQQLLFHTLFNSLYVYFYVILLVIRISMQTAGLLICSLQYE